MAAGAVRVKGLRELTRDFRNLSKELKGELNKELRKAADPVAKDAEGLALTEIRNMPASPHWAGMRIGVSLAQGVVYMVPSARRAGGSPRPGLAPQLLEQMDRALEQNQDQVVGRVDDMLGRLAGENGW